MVDYDKLLQDLQDEWEVSGLGPDDMYGQYAIEISKRANSAILAERDALNAELEATKAAYAHMVKLKDELCTELEAARKSPTL